jgi:hypothetical protein
VAYCEVVYWYTPEQTEENYKYPARITGKVKVR